MESIDYSFADQRKSVLLSDGDGEKPVILLLHGTGDTEIAWTTPEVWPDRHFDYSAPLEPPRDVGWHIYPGMGVWSFELDPQKDIGGQDWVTVLSSHDFRTARYSQIDNTGLLARPVEELGVVIDSLRKHFPIDQVVVLTQSRGGLLIRKFVKDNFANASRVGHLTKIITLHAPHQGSELASVASAINGAIQSLRGALPAAVVDAALGWLADMVNLPAYQELLVGSAFLTDLEAGEQPLPQAEYYTFGGSSVLLTAVRSWLYTLGSAVPQWHLPPFQHTITMVEVPGISPLVNSLPNLTDEITPGRGDILVADRRAHLSWSIQRTNAINHAETYWDYNLQQQVLSILGETVGIWA
jgi:hypothetical protein